MWYTTKSGKHVNTDWFDKERQIKANESEAKELNDRDAKAAGFNSKDYFNRDMHPQVIEFEEGMDANLLKGLKQYVSGVYETDINQTTGDYSSSDAFAAKQAHDEKYGISKFIDTDTSKHVNDNPTLYRGAIMNDEDFNKLLAGKPVKDLQGLTSWSDREMVAHMYAQESDMVWGDRGGKRVVFIDESKTNDGMVLPYTYPANEVLRSKSMSYTVDRVVDISEYTTAKGRENDGKSQYQKPVYYVYVKGKRSK